MAELTNPQVALQAAVDSYRRVEGDSWNFRASETEITSRADSFLQWLDRKDRRNP